MDENEQWLNDEMVVIDESDIVDETDEMVVIEKHLDEV